MYQMTWVSRSQQSVHKQVVMTADFYSALRSCEAFSAATQAVSIHQALSPGDLWHTGSSINYQFRMCIQSIARFKALMWYSDKELFSDSERNTRSQLMHNIYGIMLENSSCWDSYLTASLTGNISHQSHKIWCNCL